VLTVPGEPVGLRYGIVCAPRADGLPCDGSGTVYLRAGQTGPFRPYPLQRGDESKDGRYFLDVPAAAAESPDGFAYYAVLRDDATGATVSIPSGGADAPQISMALHDPATIRLGRHAFGAVRDPDAHVVTAGWGVSPDDVGLAGSLELGLSGPSSFDVEQDGSVDVLDSVNGRILRWANGRREIVRLDGAEELADFAAEPDGSFDVLEPGGLLKRFRADGTTRWQQKLSDRTWAKLEHGSAVLQEPSEQWMPVADGGQARSRTDQAHAARPDKRLANGHGLLVARVGATELRLAEVQGNAPVRAWRITSETPLGEVQLAEAHGSRIVVVIHAYTDDRDEFVVLVLDANGLATSFSVASDSWTETAPLARFRLARGSLYRLRTTPSGAFVDRFDLVVPR
jgi:hypothetical protein